MFCVLLVHWRPPFISPNKIAALLCLTRCPKLIAIAMLVALNVLFWCLVRRGNCGHFTVSMCPWGPSTNAALVVVLGRRRDSVILPLSQCLSFLKAIFSILELSAQVAIKWKIIMLFMLSLAWFHVTCFITRMVEKSNQDRLRIMFVSFVSVSMFERMGASVSRKLIIANSWKQRMYKCKYLYVRMIKIITRTKRTQ